MYDATLLIAVVFVKTLRACGRSTADASARWHREVFDRCILVTLWISIADKFNIMGIAVIF